MKKFISLIMAAVMLLSMAGCGSKELPEDVSSSQSQVTQQIIPDTSDTESGSKTETENKNSIIDRDGRYFDKENVALYIHTYGHLPKNFITKDEARDLGWEGGNVEEYAPGCAIGGDVFGNREGLLPKAKGRTYYECDIDTDGYHSRGSRRIVFSDDGLIYYTHDHYENFELLYGEE